MAFSRRLAGFLTAQSRHPLTPGAVPPLQGVVANEAVVIISGHYRESDGPCASDFRCRNLHADDSTTVILLGREGAGRHQRSARCDSADVLWHRRHGGSGGLDGPCVRQSYLASLPVSRDRTHGGLLTLKCECPQRWHTVADPEGRALQGGDRDGIREPVVGGAVGRSPVSPGIVG